MRFSEFPALSFGLFPAAIPILPGFLLGGGSLPETLSETVLQENFGNNLPDLRGKVADESAD